jgi:6-phosphogluconolactonase
MEAAIPGLHGEQVVSATPEQAVRALTERLIRHLRRRLQDAPFVHLALSGGSSGALLCNALATDEDLDVEHWSRTHVWMVDERGVADNDPRLNFALIRDRLAAKVGLPRANLHPMPVLATGGARDYRQQLDAALAHPTHSGCLDAVVLGMGPDGHIASLFPNSPALDEQVSSVVVNDGDTVTPPRPRMTMTYPVLNRARLIALLVTGAGKRPALTTLASGTANFRSLPVAGVTPRPDSEMIWYLDRAAAPTAP